MFFQLTDRRFELAARDPEECERLLKHYRGVRKWCFVSFVVGFAGLLAYGAWLFHRFYQVMAVLSGNGKGPVTPPDINILKVIIFPVAAWAVACLFLAISADSMAKVILLVRSLQKGGVGKAAE
jgi:hypothetical protein